MTAAAALLVFFVGGPITFWFAAHAYFGTRLANNAGYRRDRGDELRDPKVGRIYQRVLAAGLGLLDTLMGPLELRRIPRAVGVCLTLSFVYSSTFLFIAWAFFGSSGQFNRIELLPAWSPAARGGAGFGFFIYIGIMWFLGRWARRRGAVALVLVLVLAGAGVGALVLAGAGVGALVLAGAGAVAFAVAGAGAGAGALFTSWNIESATVLLFWGLLPSVNALWDWLSWCVSRWFGQNLLGAIRAQGWPWGQKMRVAAKDIILDALIAIVFLVCLAATLPLVVGWFNQLVAPDIGHAPFPLGGTTGYICQVRADPWGQGSWAMLMLISTLFPTALHALAALTALLVVPAHHLFGAGKIADRLDAIPADYLAGGDAAHSATIDDTARHLTKAWLGVWVAVALLLTAVWHLTLPGWLDRAVAWFGDVLVGAAFWGLGVPAAC